MTTRAQPAKRKAEELGDVAGPKKLRRPIAEGPIVRRNTITVLVGRPTETFTVDKNILLKSSQFLKNTLSSPSKKNPPKEEVRLYNTARSFEIYLKWLHSGYFYILEEKDASLSKNAFTNWAQCYRLGHDLRDLSFKDACIDLAQETMISNKGRFTDLAYTIYTISPAPQAHKNFALDTAAYLWCGTDFEVVQDEDSPVEFLVDLIAYIGPKMRRKELAGSRDAGDFFRNVGCKYHAHGLTSPCYKKTNPADEEVEDWI